MKVFDVTLFMSKRNASFEKVSIFCGGLRHVDLTFISRAESSVL